MTAKKKLKLDLQKDIDSLMQNKFIGSMGAYEQKNWSVEDWKKLKKSAIKVSKPKYVFKLNYTKIVEIYKSIVFGACVIIDNINMQRKRKK